MLPSHLVPQANSPERIVALARYIAAHGASSIPADFEDPRDLAYYRNALRLLGWVDDDGLPTPAVHELPDGDEVALRLAFLAALERSPLGTVWLAHAGVTTLADADPNDIEAMLEATTELSVATRRRRASTLRQWLRWFDGAPPPARSRPPADQLGLFAPSPPRDEAQHWPDPERFPHNEGASVGRIVEADLAEPGDVLIVTGYASLDRVIHLLASRDYGSGGTLRILFGNEPFAARRDTARVTGARLADEVRDHWLERGFSVLLARDVIAARDALERQPIEVRAASPRRSIHAKLYCSDRGVTLGSSNYTAHGMRSQSEANARFTPEDSRFDEARALAEGLWARGEDYREDLLELLDALLRRVTWQEALARACAELLEGEWARRYVPPEELDALEPKLWPHQVQGISQAMWILHNLGSVLVADATGSGKTRMGAWLLRAAFDRQVAVGRGQRVQPVVVAPPPVVRSWSAWLQECGLRWQVDSHGPLSNTSAQDHGSLVKAIGETELLAVDEAHNFLNATERTRRLRSHYADNAVLFTATPINRGASDLLSLVELLGPDNFDDTALDILKALVRLRRRGKVHAEESDREELRRQIQQFMVRRTRRDLNRIVDAAPEAYHIEGRRTARYPRHVAQYYDVPATDDDLRRAAEIVALADQIKGVARLGRKLKLPRA